MLIWTIGYDVMTVVQMRVVQMRIYPWAMSKSFKNGVYLSAILNLGEVDTILCD